MEALSTKFGTVINSSGTAATSQNAANAQINPSTGFYNGNASSGGTRITHYGYEKLGDPNYDSNSANGIGAFGDNKLVAGVSLAFSPDLIAEYNLQPLQTGTVTLANGKTITGQYADKTATDLSGRVDIYDPNNTITFDGASDASIDGGAPIAAYGTRV